MYLPTTALVINRRLIVAGFGWHDHAGCASRELRQMTLFGGARLRFSLGIDRCVLMMVIVIFAATLSDR